MACSSSHSSEPSPCEDDKSSHDSLAATNFILNDAAKRTCLEALHSSVNNVNKSTEKGFYSSSTSDWARGVYRSKNVSLYAYSLLKVRRWLLMDENFLFDPLKNCKRQIKLTPSNTFWRTFEGTEHFESKLSVDGIIASSMPNHDPSVSFAGLKKLDAVLEILDNGRTVEDDLDANIFLSRLSNLDKTDLYATAPFTRVHFDDFISEVGDAVDQSVCGETVPEKTFEDMFYYLVHCVIDCIGGETLEHGSCRRTVPGCKMGKVNLKVKLREEEKNFYLEIASKPDLYIYYRRAPLFRSPKLLLAVVEVKGKRNNKIVHSDEEVDDDLYFHANERESRSQSDLPPLDEEDEENDEDDETDLEKLRSTPPEWLGNLKDLPHNAQRALKKSLPQLIGEMYCSARRHNIKCLKTKDGLLIGIAVIGLDIYFVSMIDSHRDSSESVINAETAVTNVFVTRPLTLLVREDRRVILKTLCAILLSPMMFYV